MSSSWPFCVCVDVLFLSVLCKNVFFLAVMCVCAQCVDVLLLSVFCKIRFDSYMLYKFTNLTFSKIFAEIYVFFFFFFFCISVSISTTCKIFLFC